MTFGDLSTGVEIAWWIALGVGLAVAGVVWVLLEVLRRSVLAVREGVDAVLSMGGRLAQNTWTVQLFETTKERAVELLGELEEHKATDGRSGS